MANKRILIGICNGGTIHAKTATSLISALDTLKSNGGIDYKVTMIIGGDKPHGMNRMVREALEEDFDVMMSIDNDMVFPPDGIMKLLENDKDIVGANYAVRGNGVEGRVPECVIKLHNEKGEKISTTIDQLPKTVFKCAGLGNGFTMYKTELFKKMSAPWFANVEDAEGNWGTEDSLFHEAAIKAGFEVWCNPTIEMAHLGIFPYRI